MSSFEFNKIFAGVLVGALVAMLAGFIADKLVEPKELEQNAYVVAVPEAAAPAAGGGEAAPTGPEPVAPLLASADVAAGQKLTRACAACHSFDKGGPNKVGPNLWGIIGASKAHAEGFAYSPAMTAAPGEWTYDDLNQFIFNPKAAVPGTKMNYAGIKDTKDRANLIAYLHSLSDNPAPLP